MNPPASRRSFGRPFHLHLRIPPLVVTAIAAGLGWLGATSFPAGRLELAGRDWLAGGFLVLGVACSVLGVVAFRHARTSVNPLKPGVASTLVVSGIYRITRNPMYLGFLLLLLGEIAWLAHPFALGAVPAFVLYLNRFQIAPEEHALRTRFGPEYSAYAARVRRWI